MMKLREMSQNELIVSRVDTIESTDSRTVSIETRLATVIIEALILSDDAISYSSCSLF